MVLIPMQIVAQFGLIVDNGYIINTVSELPYTATLLWQKTSALTLENGYWIWRENLHSSMLVDLYC